MIKWVLGAVVVVLVWSRVVAADISITPVDYSYAEAIPAECGVTASCNFYGINLGYLQPASETTVPDLQINGAYVQNRLHGTGNGGAMNGVFIDQRMEGTNTFGYNAGVVSSLGVNVTSTISGAFSHFTAQSGTVTASRVADIRGLDLELQGCRGTLNHSVYSIETCLPMAHAGAARFGATGDPTAGYALDVQGSEVVTGSLYVHATPIPTVTPTGATATATPTPTATPTATTGGPTPTMTGPSATPTPSVVPTPVALVNGIAITGYTCFNVSGVVAANPYAGKAGSGSTQNGFLITNRAPIIVFGLECNPSVDVPWSKVQSCEIQKTSLGGAATSDGGAATYTWVSQTAPRCDLAGTSRWNEVSCRPGAPGVAYTDGVTYVMPGEAYHIKHDTPTGATVSLTWCEGMLGAAR